MTTPYIKNVYLTITFSNRLHENSIISYNTKCIILLCCM